MDNTRLLLQFQNTIVTSLGLDGGEVEISVLQNFLKNTYGEDEGTQIFHQILEDISFFRSKDPASGEYSDSQILSVRRGVSAVCAHRIFSAVLQIFPESLYALEVMAKYVQKDTNIEIHPSAIIGVPFAIDHGHGTVIGATSILGKNIFLYHGVTLGASGKIDASGRRHPLLGDNVSCGNASQILGPCIIEDNVSLSSGTMVVNSHLQKDVKIFLRVRVSSVVVPSGTVVYSADPENSRRYWATKKGEQTPRWHIFETFVI